ncbi:MAG: transporter substrate-binding domain-containing protein [Alphaproteobacteria bacterium]|nr:transporter substrate-binding domain-containing protein [Alphaproteobacteria bacterium]
MKNIIVSAIVAACVAWATFFFVGKSTTPVETQTSSDKFLDRVEKSGELRCGYVNNPPFVILDPNTHEVSGIMVDLTAKIGELTGWKVTWPSETTYPTMTEDLARGKFDVFCGGGWPIATSEKRQWWSGPLFYSAVGAFARVDDERFGPNFSTKDLDNPAYKISFIDGVAVDRVRSMDFPRSTPVSLPNISNYGEMILQVVGGKADVVLIELETAYRYMAKNPGKIKRIDGNKPVRFYGIGYEFSFDAPRLRNVFEAASQELVYGGVVDRILTKYEEQPGMFYRVRPIGSP